MKYRTVPELLAGAFAANPEHAAYRYKTGGNWVDMTWADVDRETALLARSLIALGVEHGDRVGILSKTRIEWILCDYAIASAGGVTVGVYQSNLAPDCAFVLNHADAEIVIVENTDQLAKIVECRSEMPQLRKIVIIDGEAGGVADVISWNEFRNAGSGVDEATLEGRSRAIEPDDLASLVYTSGTTGVPKGVMITHKNLVFASWSARQSMYSETGFVTLLFLPLAHVFARIITYCNLHSATTIAIAEDICRVMQNLQEIRPHHIPSVPRIFEKVYDKIVSDAAAAGGWRKKVFDWAIGVGRQVSKHHLDKTPIPPWLRLRHGIADRLVFGKIKAAFGGRLLYAISGAAPLNRDIAEFLHACGILILEGIGMTENTSFSNVNRLDNNRFGTVGPPGPGIEVKIAEDGEVLFRGDNVMKGYFKNPEATAETLDADGWLLSGDIGEIDDGGFLRITDRKKDLIVTAGGKNVAPQKIERIMRTSHYIAQMMAHGDRKKYIAGLVTLEPEAVLRWARAHGIDSTDLDELAAEPRIQELIESEVEERNRQLASYETVKKFHILPRDFTLEAGEMTPTGKLKRKVLVEKYREQLEALY